MMINEHPTIYHVCIEGHLDERWQRWFEGLDISLRSEGVTVISGVIDQAALHGILNRIRDLNLVLISVQRTLTVDVSNKGKV